MTLPYASGYHAPVMAREVMDLLRPERGGTFLDGTLGGGGHAEALLERGPQARLIGVDRDPDALAEASARLRRFGDRFTPVRANFADAVDAAGQNPVVVVHRPHVLGVVAADMLEIVREALPLGEVLPEV